MPNLTRVKPGQPIRASEWNAIIDRFNGGVNAKAPPLNGLFTPTVLVRNDVGRDLDRYSSAALGDPLYQLETDGSVDLVFALEAADSDKPTAILTEPIAHDATNKRFGRCWIHGLAYALVGPGTATLRRANPDATNDRLEPAASGLITLLASPNAGAERLLPVLIGTEVNGGFVTDIRVDSSEPKFELSRDGGTTWVDWHEGTECSQATEDDQQV